MKTTLTALLSLCALALVAQDSAETGATNFVALAKEQEAAAAPAEASAAPAGEKAPERAPAPEATRPPEQDAAPAAGEPTGEGASAANEAPAPIQEEGIDEIDLEEDDSAIAARKPQIKGEISEGTTSLVDIECDEATLSDILRQFRKTTGANIISDDSTNLQRRVSVSLRHVPWLQGMTAILSSRGFRLEVHDNIYRVVEDLQAIPVSTRTFQLNHASAKELADLFNATYAPKDQTGRIRAPIASSFAGANVVVVTASDKTISDCETIINAVDKAVAQIYIEARFIELSNEALHKIGMQWNSLESWGASVRNLSGGWEYNNGHSASYGSHLTTRSITSTTTDSSTTSANTSLSGGNTSSSASSSSSPNSSVSDSKTYSGLLPNSIGAAVGAGRDAASMAWHNARGFQGQLSVDDFRLALSAFETMSDAKVFSNPKIIVSNGKEAKVDMTTKYPNVTIDSNYTGQNSQNLSISTKLDTIPGEDKFMFAKEAFFSWGIELSVTPRISPDGLISVEIVPTISDCTGYLTVNSSQETDTPYTQYPIIEVKRLTTEFTMKDGATAVIGGLSKTTEEDVDSGIPYLRKIPYVGPKLFGWKSRGKVQKEILVFVTVGIADPSNLPQDVGLPKNAVMGREFVRGNQLEPGDRTNAAPAVLQLNLKPLDEREPPRGEVRIVPVAEK
ncbi:MAG: hypothetical protein IJ829_08860 [Kiritimatiellae bacterium]|nr:hypothetical protein [Kiritimatiellia bacterium]